MTLSPQRTELAEDQRPLLDDEQELVSFLERDQLESDRSRPVGRAHLSGRTTAGLWALRVFVIVVSAMVVYTFISQISS